MKSNRYVSMKKDSSGQAGIGTLIIFIAMVLVASVAAGVLIQTSGVLQQRAQSTGKQVTEEISSNLNIIGIEGLRAKNSSSDVSGSVDLLKMKIGLNIGSSNVDLSTLVITMSDGKKTSDLVYAGNTMLYGSPMDGYSEESFDGNLAALLNNTHEVAGTNIDHFFIVDRMRDDDHSITVKNPILTAGDIAFIYIGTVNSDSVGYTYLADFNGTASSTSLKDSGLVFTPRATVDIQMTPEKGSQTFAQFRIPTLGAKESYLIYP